MKTQSDATVREARRASIVGKKRRGRPPGRRNSPRAEVAGPPADVTIAPTAAGVCPNADCSAPYSDGEGFCAKCGIDLRGNVCDGCDEPFKPGATFCPKCGNKRSATVATIPHDDERAAAKLPPAPEVVLPSIGAATPLPAEHPLPAAAAPARRPLFTKLFVSMAWVSIAVQIKALLGDDFRTIDPAEVDMLVDATQEVLDRRANIGGENADLWRLAIVGGVVFIPRIFVVWVKAKRELARQAADDADRAIKAHAEPSGPPPVRFVPPLEVAP